MSDDSDQTSPNGSEEQARKLPARRSKYRIEGDSLQSRFESDHARADFKFWAKMPVWTIEEGIALALEKDPEVVSWSVLQSSSEVSYAERYRRKRMLAQRAVTIGRLSDPCAPADFLKWAIHYGVQFPPDLQTAVADYNRECERRIQGDGHGGVTAPESESQKTLNLAFKIIAGLSIAIYKRDPTKKKNDAHAEMASDLALVGIDVGEKTIRKYVGLGMEIAGFV